MQTPRWWWRPVARNLKVMPARHATTVISAIRNLCNDMSWTCTVEHTQARSHTSVQSVRRASLGVTPSRSIRWPTQVWSRISVNSVRKNLPRKTNSVFTTVRILVRNHMNAMNVNDVFHRNAPCRCTSESTVVRSHSAVMCAMLALLVVSTCVCTGEDIQALGLMLAICAVSGLPDGTH